LDEIVGISYESIPSDGQVRQDASPIGELLVFSEKYSETVVPEYVA
jgi:hypothetical protein